MNHFSTKPNYKNTVMNLFIHKEILGISSLGKKKGQNYSIRTYNVFISSVNFFFSYKRTKSLHLSRGIHFRRYLCLTYFYKIMSLQCLFQILSEARLSSLNTSCWILMVVILLYLCSCSLHFLVSKYIIPDKKKWNSFLVWPYIEMWC